MPGEWYSPTQPFPTKPPAYARNGVTPDDLIDFTPALHDQALTIVAKYKLGPIWPSASFDPETHVVYTYACNACVEPVGLVPSPKEVSDMRYVKGTAGQQVRVAHGPRENAGADSPMPKASPRSAGGGGGLNVQGLPMVKPPYGTISAIDLDNGVIMWQAAHGDTPDVVRNHPLLKGLTIPRTGQMGYNIGTLVTKTLVIAGDGQVTITPEHPRGAMLRAYSQATGKEVGAVYMPAPQSGSPMTYMINGKQYIVVAISGGNYSGEYVAFTLPDAQ